jgi:predicted DNA binding CopG/RHH family protein
LIFDWEEDGAPFGHFKNPQSQINNHQFFPSSRRTKQSPAEAPCKETIKIEANKRDVPYQSLIKMALADHFHPPAGS